MSNGRERLRPIVKWAGGKRNLLPQILAHVPRKMNTYAEPFAGGAAVFFGLAGAPSRRREIGRAILADQNEDLVACYRAVRDDVEAVIRALAQYKYDRDLFYRVRDLDPTTMDDVERGSRLLFLNRTCFNGLWRVNASGRFNVPFGKYKSPVICDEKVLRAASSALHGVSIEHADFADVACRLEKGDFAYFDPPYVPVSRTASFTAYGALGFGPGDQARLVAELHALRRRGAKALLSNADTPETRALYQDFAAFVVKVPRRINARSERRGDVSELLVSTWGRPGVVEAVEC